jgi:hypothetical protein
VKEGTGRIVRFELIPLEELGGRPRVDCLCSLSGIFRDSFQNVVELLDDLFQRAAAAEGEDPERNYVKKHALEMKGKGLDNTVSVTALNIYGRGDHFSFLFTLLPLFPSYHIPLGFLSLFPSISFTYKGRSPVLQPLWRLRVHGRGARGRLPVGLGRRAGGHLGRAQRLQVR